MVKTAPSTFIHAHLESPRPRGLCVLHLGSIPLAQELCLNHPGAHKGLVRSMHPLNICLIVEIVSIPLLSFEPLKKKPFYQQIYLYLSGASHT